jgi:uncharacterized protein YbjT (DUF2867 family)
VRDPARANLPAGVEVARGDLGRPDTLRPALEGVDAVFLLWPSFSAEGAAAVVDLIAAHARRVVYLSSMNVADDRGAGASEPWRGIERLIECSGVDWTFLRVGGFATNTLAWADEIRRDGVVRWVYGAAARSLIHEADIAAVAVQALIGDGHGGAKYVLTGPEAITQAEQVRIIGEVIGRSVAWEELPPAVAREQLLDFWDESYLDAAFRYWASLVEAPEPVTRTVEELTGVPARTFRAWVADHIGDFRPPLASITQAAGDPRH